MRKLVYEGSYEDIKPTIIWGIILTLLRLVTEARREYKEGRDVRYLPVALEYLACMLRKQMRNPKDARLNVTRNNLVKSDPHYFVALDRLGLSCLREEDDAPKAQAPAPWCHEWSEDDFDEDESKGEGDADTENNAPTPSATSPRLSDLYR